MNATLTVEFTVPFAKTRKQGRRVVAASITPRTGRLPRVAKLMALALRMEGLLRDGVVADYAALARLGRVTRARVTQIMNLLLLAPDLQEALLFWPPVTRGRDPLVIRQLQPIAATADWNRQRALWQELTARLAEAAE